MHYLKKPKFISAFFDVQGCTNAAGSWMSRSVDVQDARMSRSHAPHMDVEGRTMQEQLSRCE